MTAHTNKEVLIDYTNYRGVRSVRGIRPTGRVVFESNEWHPEPQWLLYAIDLGRNNEIRTFAMKNIHSWQAP
jgi:hypothetical protein